MSNEKKDLQKDLSSDGNNEENSDKSKQCEPSTSKHNENPCQPSTSRNQPDWKVAKDENGDAMINLNNDVRIEILSTTVTGMDIYQQVQAMGIEGFVGVAPLFDEYGESWWLKFKNQDAVKKFVLDEGFNWPYSRSGSSTSSESSHSVQVLTGSSDLTSQDRYFSNKKKKKKSLLIFCLNNNAKNYKRNA